MRFLPFTSSTPRFGPSEGSSLRRFIGYSDGLGASLVVVSLLVLIAHWALVLLFLVPRLGTLDFLRLHYTAALGVDWVGPWWYIFTFPLLGFLFFFMNGFLAGRLASRDRVLGNWVMGATVAIEALLAVGGAGAVFLNS